MPTALVTGASGGLGRRIVGRLRANGWRVRALVHHAAVPDADEAVQGSLLEPDACAEAVEGCDAVLHAAATTHARSERRYRAVNVEGTRALVEATRAAGIDRFVLLSTRTASPASGWYGESKLAAERIVSVSGLRWTILRLAEVYGAGQGEGVDDVIARARAGRLIVLPGNGESELCPLHVDDAALACANTLDADSAVGRTFVVGGDCLTLRELAERCIARSNSQSRTIKVPWAVLVGVSVAARVLPLPMYPDQVKRLRAAKPTARAAVLAELSVTPRLLDDWLRATGPARIGS
jgi:nucleoside-diphosphate-sugar epimerase